MLPASKRARSPSPPPPLKKSKIDPSCCAFCSFSQEKTKDEGELRKFKIKDNTVYVHDRCLQYSGRTSGKESDIDIVKRVVSRPSNYKCRFDECACQKPTGATIGCSNRKCKQVYHYRCAITAGTMLASGHFYCSKHTGDIDDLIQVLERNVNWPGEVPYQYTNDWSAILPEDMQLITSCTTGWDTWSDIHTQCVRIVRVEKSHWAWTENMPYDLQASEDIREEEAICEIVGVLRKVDADLKNPDHYTDVFLPDITENKFMATFTEGSTKKLIIDSSETANEGRYVNFLTPKAKEMNLTPNGKLVTVWSMGKLKNVLIATANIKPGESVILDDSSVFLQEDATNGNNKNAATINKKRIHGGNYFPIYNGDDHLDDDPNYEGVLDLNFPDFSEPDDSFPAIPSPPIPPSTSPSSSAPAQSLTSSSTLPPSAALPSSSLPADDDDDFHPITIDHINNTTIVHSPTTPTPIAPSISSKPPASSTASAPSLTSPIAPPALPSTPIHKSTSSSSSRNATPHTYNTRHNYTPVAFILQSGPPSYQSKSTSRKPSSPPRPSSPPSSQISKNSSSSSSPPPSSQTPRSSSRKAPSPPHTSSPPPRPPAFSKKANKRSSSTKKTTSQNLSNTDQTTPPQTTPSQITPPQTTPPQTTPPQITPSQTTPSQTLPANNISTNKLDTSTTEINPPKTDNSITHINATDTKTNDTKMENGSENKSPITPSKNITVLDLRKRQDSDIDNNNNNIPSDNITNDTRIKTNSNVEVPNADENDNSTKDKSITKDNTNNKEINSINNNNSLTDYNNTNSNKETNNINGNNNNNNNTNNISPSSDALVPSEPPPNLAVLGPIDSKIDAIYTKYCINVLSEAYTPFDNVPFPFFYDLKKLDSECYSALLKETDDHQMQVGIAQDMKQLLEKSMDKAPSQEMKDKLRIQFSVVELELAKKEHNLVLDELRIRHKRIRLTLKRAVEAIDVLRTDITENL